MKKGDVLWIKCPYCSGTALGNYKHNPRMGKCTVCHKVFGYKEKKMPPETKITSEEKLQDLADPGAADAAADNKED
jgi:hypothetical protein